MTRKTFSRLVVLAALSGILPAQSAMAQWVYPTPNDIRSCQGADVSPTTERDCTMFLRPLGPR